jgi:hypothetical protein
MRPVAARKLIASVLEPRLAFSPAQYETSSAACPEAESRDPQKVLLARNPSALSGAFLER